MVNKGYLVYLDDVLLPITPSNITLSIKNQNKTISLINGSEMNVLQSPGLTDISFEMIIPQITKYPFAVYQNNEFKGLTYYSQKLEDSKINKTPIRFKVIRRTPTGETLYDTNIMVSLESYDIKDDTKNGFDVSISVKLKQYIDRKTKILPVASDKKVTSSKNNRVTTKQTPNTYVVKLNDTLWAICKKYLGDGTKFHEVAKLNNIKNPNLIYPNQVIRLK